MWEVVRAVRSARTAEPELEGEPLLALVADNAGIPLRLIHTAVRYWAAYPTEIDVEIDMATAAEQTVEQVWTRERDLLRRRDP